MQAQGCKPGKWAMQQVRYSRPSSMGLLPEPLAPCPICSRAVLVVSYTHIIPRIQFHVAARTMAHQNSIELNCSWGTPRLPLVTAPGQRTAGPSTD